MSRRSFTDIDLRLRMRTARQLRTPEPRPWEAGWVFWNYGNEDRFYYLVLKPTGWELGKQTPTSGPDQRIIKAGEDHSFPVGPWYDVRVVQIGSTITVPVDGRWLFEYTDESGAYPSGKIGLYTEDASVRFDDIVVRRP